MTTPMEVSYSEGIILPFPENILTFVSTYPDILYEFEVSVRQSTCSKDAGNGAFLTYK